MASATIGQLGNWDGCRCSCKHSTRRKDSGARANPGIQRSLQGHDSWLVARLNGSIKVRSHPIDGGHFVGNFHTHGLKLPPALSRLMPRRWQRGQPTERTGSLGGWVKRRGEGGEEGGGERGEGIQEAGRETIMRWRRTSVREERIIRHAGKRWSSVNCWQTHTFTLDRTHSDP